MRTISLIPALLMLLAACGGTEPQPVDNHETRGDTPSQGPHGGRLLSDGSLAIEITFFERGVAPEFHVYAYRNAEPIDPEKVQLTIELARLGGRPEQFAFQPREDYLLGDRAVAEPHSFDVKVRATVDGAVHEWSYPSYEGRTSIPAQIARDAGVETAVAGPGELREQLTLYGAIQPNAERVRSVTARYPGVIRTVSRTVGDAVKAGDVLATVESNESLQVYSVVAPIGGTVTQRLANPGEATAQDPLFVVADFSTVWAELSVFPNDRSRLAIGQQAQIASSDGRIRSTGRISYVAPIGGTNQTLVTRVVLDNQDSRWTPGVFVTGAITTATHAVPLAVPLAAIQNFRDWKVVFLNVGDLYEVRPVELGREDAAMVEVTAGLNAGDRYVTGNSFLIKADIEKSGASHEH
jgi:cobalt-zinc-cadmium efflux system membrane fusion protein